MSVVSDYQIRGETLGADKRTRFLNREKRLINKRLPDNISYKKLHVEETMSGKHYEQNIAVINTDEFATKHIFSMPDEDIIHGSIISWMDNKWLVTVRDANTEICTRATMVQCNYKLKWVDDDTHKICEQWCVIASLGSGLTGEFEDKFYIGTRGDTRFKIMLPRNKFTAKISRENRFIIDDPDSKHPLAYGITKPMAPGNSYDGNGILEYGLLETNTTEYDNLDLYIADYYKYFNRYTGEEIDQHVNRLDPENNKTEHGSGVWL